MRYTQLLTVACVCLSAIASAQQTGFYTDGRPEVLYHPHIGLDQSDVKFLKTAAAISRFEIDMAKLAQSNGSSAFVKEYAKDMDTDHTAALTEAVQTAQTDQVGLGSMPPMMEHELRHLGNLQGDQFDEAYRNAEITGHEQAIAIFKNEVENGHDELVKAYAVKMLPDLELHLHLAIAKQSETGPTTKADHGM